MKYFYLSLLLVCSSMAFGTNGMFMIGYGARASAMGGAEVAVPSDCSAIASNPANIASICNQSFAFSTSFLMPSIEMSTTTDGVRDAKEEIFPIPLLAYGDHIGTSKFSYAVGIFVQGGMGAHFDKYDASGFGTEGSLKSNFSYGKFTPTIAYNILDNLAIGASFELGYSRMALDFLPQLAATFGGFELQNSDTLSYGVRVGLYYQLNDEIGLGFAYALKTPLNFEGDFVQEGQPTVDGELIGFKWPHVFEMGVSFAPTERLLLALDISYINWDEAINTAKIKRDGQLYMPMAMNWTDQVVVAIGAEYAIGDHHKIRAGYNYGESPVPEETLSPLFPAILEHHITVGYGYDGENFSVDLAYERALENSQTSKMQPLFAGYRISQSQNTLHIAFKYHF